LRVDVGRGSRGAVSSLPPETSCEVYNKNGEERALTSITKSSRLIPLVEFSEILISSTSINLVLELKECLLLDELQPTTRRERTIVVEQDEESINEEEAISQKEEEVTQAVTNEEPAESHNTDELEDASTGGDLEEVDIQVDEEISTPEEGLTEIDSLEVTTDEPLTLKEPNEVYREIYKAAIAKAKRLRQVALDAYLDAKKIKARFMLEDVEDSDDEEDMEDSEVYTQKAFQGN